MFWMHASFEREFLLFKDCSVCELVGLHLFLGIVGAVECCYLQMAMFTAAGTVAICLVSLVSDPDWWILPMATGGLAVVCPPFRHTIGRPVNNIMNILQRKEYDQRSRYC